MEPNKHAISDEAQSSPCISIADVAPDNTNQVVGVPTGLVLGENCSPEFTAEGVGDLRVSLFFKLVRNIPDHDLAQLLQDVLKVARSIQGDTDSELVCAKKAAFVADAFIMAFQTRNCRGGKGERDLFYKLILHLSKDFPNTVASLMSLVPTFGSYKDWFSILLLAQDQEKTVEQTRVNMKPTVNAIVDLVRDQLLIDQRIMNEQSSNMDTEDPETTTNKISLLCKWAPREGHAMDALVKHLAKHVFPTSACPKKDYRKLVAALNQAIRTTEVAMSSNRWDEVRFGSVPSVCMMKHRKAFLNEKVKGPPPTADQMETGNRHPEDEKRVACRKRLAQTLLDERCNKIKGRQLFPHEITSKIGEINVSGMEKLLFEKQWVDIRNSVIQAFEAKAASSQDSTSKVMNLGKIIPLSDVSGSMSGTPMEVAIALGILTSELAAPEFAHRIITFHESPSWVVLSSEMSLHDKVETVRRAPWGGSTNFENVLELILAVAKEGNLTPEQIPDLLVLSDMQFDEANHGNPWETQHQRIVRRFKETGIEVCGREWPCPTITYWNLRGNTVGFPAQADTPGVNMLSGFSPSLMTAILQGDDMGNSAVEEGGVESAKSTKNPYDTLRTVLDDASYDSVRAILKQSQEGVLSYYN